MHKDDVVTDAALVRRPLADQFLEWAAPIADESAQFAQPCLERMAGYDNCSQQGYQGGEREVCEYFCCSPWALIKDEA